MTPPKLGTDDYRYEKIPRCNDNEALITTTVLTSPGWLRADRNNLLFSSTLSKT